jgi:menaquinol-cytochrome c reductase iron-sulfur subunit
LPNRRKPRPKYTLERDIPGAFEGETVTRRRAMVLFANGVGGVAAAAFTLPALGFALAPVFKAQPMAWQAVGPPDDFTEDNYTIKVITLVPGIGEAGFSIAYMRQRNPAIDTEPENEYNHWLALSSRCMHLGCPVRWVTAAERFVCPCHGGVYNIRGIPVGGPPVRPLDRFFTRLNQSTGLVEVGPRYSVNMELRIFSPRDPAEPLDGIGQYLYPARWSTNPFPPGT